MKPTKEAEMVLEAIKKGLVLDDFKRWKTSLYNSRDEFRNMMANKVDLINEIDGAIEAGIIKSHKDESRIPATVEELFNLLKDKGVL